MARSRYRSQSHGGGLLDNLTNLIAIALVLIVGWLAWPMLVKEFSARTAGAPGQAQPTQPTGSFVRPTLPPYQPATPAAPNVQQGIDQYNAAEQARADALAAAAAAAPVPNTDTTNDSAPLVHESKAVPDRQPAGENVPTAEPLVQAESTDLFGSKPVAAPVNIQETHQCLHGQVWTASGCHRPTPTQ